MSHLSTTQQTGAAQEPSTGEAQRYLRFTLNGELYALDILHVTEILEHRQLTAVPMMPDFIRGVINLRGRVVPVVDLAMRFGRGVTAIARRTSIIIVRITNPALAEVTAGGERYDVSVSQDIGILVDVVNKVVPLTADQIEPAPAFGAGIRADYISGMAKRDHDFVIVLDIDRVLSLTDIVSLQLAAEPSGADAGGRTRTSRSS